MRSGTGRHRRPRQAPAVVVAAGVTGAGIALPFLAASGAQAADGAVWDRVAECESGGAWSANNGSGYYGGFQLTLDTWAEYGGTEHADRPDLASRGQQIAVAEAILAAEGPDAWPGCAVTSGLTASVNGVVEAPGVPGDERSGSADGGNGSGDRGGSAGSDASDGARGSDRAEQRGVTQTPNAADAADPSDTAADDAADPQRPDPSDAPDVDAAPSADPEGTGGPATDASEDRAEPEASPSDEAALPDDAASGGAAGEGPGRHRGAPDPREADPEGTGRSDRGAARHAAPADRTGPAGAAEEHRVAPGDSLSGIAAERGVEGGWPALYEANASVVGADPDLILPGQSLELPGEQR
ncbi:resuscitation-promoting factor protein RpfC [Streptomyces chumphonensis]|uniref:Transglycosylase family protein n=1 Tax=Streptomyces chumphonensis TaxID=1214925 RepID=A0A927F1C5_9ACTN|nr:transglycosylase family protein [Streptomyces chumphonensis]MBD3933416.1 transglycosylase family protein [Streptomyces chumphonensis]